MVAETAGARTQGAGLVAAVLMAIVLVAAGGITSNLPQAALAAVVVSAALALFDLRGMVRLARIRRTEFGLCVACLAGVALVGVLEASSSRSPCRCSTSSGASGGRTTRYSAGCQDKGIPRHRPPPRGAPDPGSRHVPVRLAALLRQRRPLPRPRPRVGGHRGSTRPLGGDRPEPITDVDATAADMLVTLDQELETAGVRLVFAELKGHVRDHLRDYGVLEEFAADQFFPTLGRLSVDTSPSAESSGLTGRMSRLPPCELVHRPAARPVGGRVGGRLEGAAEDHGAAGGADGDA